MLLNIQKKIQFSFKVKYLTLPRMNIRKILVTDVVYYSDSPRVYIDLSYQTCHV